MGRYDFTEGEALASGFHWGRIQVLSDRYPDETYVSLMFSFFKPQMRYSFNWGKDRLQRRRFIAMAAWGIKFRWRIGVHWSD